MLQNNFQTWNKKITITQDFGLIELYYIIVLYAAQLQT
jgi:hypothetical protein